MLKYLKENAIFRAAKHECRPAKVKKEISRSTYLGWRQVVDKPFLMYNQNVAYFDRYIALYLARLLMSLEDLATVLNGMFTATIPDLQPKSSDLGYHVIRSWIRDLQSLLRGSDDVA